MGQEIIRIANELAYRRRYNSIAYTFSDDVRLGYYKHLDFFKAGATFKERCFLAGNRVGKSVAGAFETACHATGRYPDWWEGKRFSKPPKIWCAGDTGKTTRDILQYKLLGEPADIGSGLIPKKYIGKTLNKVGVPDAIEVVYVKHKSGGWSQVNFKSFDQRREGFQGTEIDVGWLDEECPQEIYTELLLRTMTTGGIVFITFTPLMGLSDVVLNYCPNGEVKEGGVGTKYLVSCDWDAAPHLTAKDKEDLLASIPPFQRDARSKGLPQLGSGAIYQVPESEIVVDDFEIPEHWKRVYGMDVGWNKTAVVWGAYDEEGTLYLYSEHYRGIAEPIIHAESIKARGKWIRGVIDPASRGRGQRDGISLLDLYINLGLQLNLANNAVESGLYEVWERLSSGRLRVFKSLSNWRNEYRIYRRDEKGNVVKKNDHLMDATRYLVMSGSDFSAPKNEKTSKFAEFGSTMAINGNKGGSTSWMN
jgi:phage terminase large subunit-like protein